MMMHINTPGVADGEVAFWIDDTLSHRETGMHWRDVPELGLNQARLQHYIEAGDASRSNRISFDDVVVSTERIGCSAMSMPRLDGGVALSDGGPSARSDGGGRPGTDGSTSTLRVDGGGGDPDPARGGCGCTTVARASSSSRALPLWAVLLGGAWLWSRFTRRPDRTGARHR